MGLKEEIKKIMSKFFGTKRLTAVSEIEKENERKTESMQDMDMTK